MSESNVVALPGFSIPDTEPVQDVIDILEAALARARDGKLKGIALIEVEREPTAFATKYYAADNRHTLAAGIMSLSWQVGRLMSESDD